MSKRTKRSFTLLELTVVLTILSIASGAVLYSLQGMIRHHRYESSTARIYNELLYLQSAALSHHALFQIEITPSYFIIKTDEPNLAHKNEKISLSGIESIRSSQAEKEKINITLHPSGRILPEQLIELVSPKGKTLYLDLRYPLAISLASSYRKKPLPEPLLPKQSRSEKTR